MNQAGRLAAVTAAAVNLSAAVSFQLSNFTVGCNPTRVISGDFNGDGKADLAFTCKAGSSSLLTVLAGAGDGTFGTPALVSGPALGTLQGNRLVAADFNRDGKTDLAYIATDGSLNILISNGDGTFNPIMTVPSNPKLALGAAGDINGDNIPDLVFLSGADDSLLTYQFGKGDGTFGLPTVVPWPQLVLTPDNIAPAPQGLNVFLQDLNGDGVLDMIVPVQMTIKPASQQPAFNIGPTFTLVSGVKGVGAPSLLFSPTFGDSNIAAADFDGNGKLDYASWGTINQGALSFALPGATLSGNNNFTVDGPGAAGDIEGDGKADFVYGSGALNAMVVLSFQSGQFQRTNFTNLGRTPIDLIVLDVNGDGQPDVVLANTSGGTVALNTSTVQPRITGALNGASFAGKSLAPGSLGSAFGTGLVAMPVGATGIPLPMSLGGLSMTVGGVAAPLLFVSPTQINFQVPWTVQAGPADLVVTTNGANLSPVPVMIAAVNPGIFSLHSGTGQAIAINADGSLAAPSGSVPGIATHPAKAGDTIIVLGTGLGDVTPTIAAGASAGSTLRSTVAIPQVQIGGMDAKVSFTGLSPQFVGVNQLNVVVPAVPAGVVALQIVGGGVTTSNQVTIAVGQ